MIGDLRHRATIESKVQTDDGGGGFSESWSTLATVWCAIAPLSGEEKVSGGQLTSLDRARIRIRFRDDVSAANRLLIEGRVFGIDRARDPDGRRHWLDLDCTESAPS